MSLAGLGSLAGGLSSGLGAGLTDAQRLQQAQQQRLAEQAKALLGKAIFNGQALGAGGQGIIGGGAPQLGPSQGGGAPMQLPGASGGQQSGAGPTGPVADYITQQAQARGINPQVALAVFKNESSLNPGAVGDGGTSGGIAQLHTGGGLGDLYKKTVDPSFDPRNPSANWQKQVGFALDQVKQGGWKPWSGARGVPGTGIGGQPPNGSQGQPPQQGMQQPQQMAGGPGSMQDMVARINQANPDASPAMKFRMLGEALPFMKQEDQEQYHQMAMQMREQMLQMREQAETYKEALGNYKAGQGDERLKQGQEKIDQGAQRQKDLQANRQQRLQLAEQGIQMSKQKWGFAKTKAEKDQAFREHQQAVKEKQQAQSEIDNADKLDISESNATSLTPEAQDRIKGDAATQRADGKARLDALKKAQQTPRNEDAPTPQAKKPIPDSYKEQFKKKIADGVPKEQVIQALQQGGYDTTGF